MIKISVVTAPPHSPPPTPLFPPWVVPLIVFIVFVVLVVLWMVREHFIDAWGCMKMKLRKNRKRGIVLSGVIIVGFIFYVGYTGQDPTHGFQNKYLLVTKARYRGEIEEEQGQVVRYMSEEEIMNRYIRKFEEKGSTVSKELIEMVARLPANSTTNNVRIPVKLTIEVYKWQWFQWVLIYRLELL